MLHNVCTRLSACVAWG
jgi:hypothetical protein